MRLVTRDGIATCPIQLPDKAQDVERLSVRKRGHNMFMIFEDAIDAGNANPKLSRDVTVVVPALSR